MESWIRNHPNAKQSDLDDLVDNKKFDEKLYDRERKAKQRAASRELVIPPPQDVSRRLHAESDPVLWQKTYFGQSFFEAFTSDREDMVLSIVAAALYSGDQAIAGPRGEGKTTISMKTALYLMIRSLSTFPVVIGKNQNKANKELKELRKQLQQNELFAADYPEISIPLQDAGDWSSRARLQTVGYRRTNMVLAADHIVFPSIEAEQMPDWPSEMIPASRGQVLYCLGIDGAIRGTKHGDKRPTLAIIDDIEDREAAASDAVIAKNEDIIEQDIAGLAQSSERVSRVMLCTIQNRKCIAYKYTDPKQKPSWRGRRYRKMVKPPDRMDLIDKYIEMRKSTASSDPDAREAFRYWRDNQSILESGAVVSNVNSYSRKVHADGEPLELSAIQAYYNRVADVGAKAVATEIDNDPPAEAGPTGNGITSDIVCSRISGLVRCQLPANTVALTAAIDIGKYRCHWVVCAWWQGAGGCVVDYGIAEVVGTDASMDNVASQPQIYKALLQWRDELLAKEYVDTTGTKRSVDFVLVDSGTFTDAVYEFIRQVRGIFHPSKGLSPYHARKQSTSDTIASSHLHASRLANQQLWLYDLDTDYWKQWIHERFLTPTFDDQNMLRRGAMSLFTPQGTHKHFTFGQHIASEELVSEFKEGKGVKTFWHRRNENNHWFDATYMAAAASEVCGIKLVGESFQEVAPRHVDQDDKKKTQPKPKVQQHGRFKTRPGGWVPRRR